jgi:hypothetical protein
MTKLSGLCMASALCFLAAGAAAQTLPPDLSGRDSHWIQDKDSRCWAANPNPQEGEAISWKGTCENNLASGPGTLTWYLNGRVTGRDEGVFKNGELSGHGKIFFEDGTSFEGEFPGEGVLTAPDGRKVPAQSVKERTGWSIEQLTANPSL